MNGKISNPAQLAYARRYTLTEGKENGVKVVEINNGILRLMLNESKNLDIMQLWHKGTNVSFLSKNGFSAKDNAFIKRFEGGMLYTCGTDSVGAREGFELHGSLHNTPAKIISCEANDKCVSVVSETYITALFGENLTLRRTVTTDVLSDTVSITDVLINNGARDADFCLLYHINLGYPMIDAGVKILSDAVSVTPRNDWAKRFTPDRDAFSDCIDGDEERCYYLKNLSPVVIVKNEKAGKKFTLNYSAKTLPYFVQWNSFASGDYALGLEPATTMLDDNFKYTSLPAGKNKKFSVNITVSDI